MEIKVQYHSEPIVEDLPPIKLDLQCTECDTVYEYLNRKSFYYPERNLPPKCPNCESLNYRRLFVRMPHLWKTRWEPPYHDPHATPIQSTGQTYTEDEYKAMAVAHALNTGETVDWKEVKKEVETKYYGFNK